MFKTLLIDISELSGRQKLTHIAEIFNKGTHFFRYSNIVYVYTCPLISLSTLGDLSSGHLSRYEMFFLTDA